MWMEGEKEDEALAYATSGSEDTFRGLLSAGCRLNGATTDRLDGVTSKACAARLEGTH
jgi:hypothetical protein